LIELTPNRRFEFEERSQLFIRTHNETLSVSMALCQKETVQQTARDDDQQNLIHAFEVVGMSGTGLFPKVRVPLGSLRNPNILRVVAAVGVVAASAVWGYSLGFKPEPNYYSKMFQAKLHNRGVWRGLARDYRSRETSPPPSRAAPSATP
jgi:hypothetical protein